MFKETLVKILSNTRKENLNKDSLNWTNKPSSHNNSRDNYYLFNCIKILFKLVIYKRIKINLFILT
jgi:hypothetical protein